MRNERLPLLIAVGALLAGMAGCWPEPTSSPVLEGTWKLVPEEETHSPLTGCDLTFDSSGQLTEVSFTFGDSATVYWDDPPASVSVNEDSLTISVTQGGNSLVFEGTLDSVTAPTKAQGTMTLNYGLGNMTVSIDRGQASLVKQ